MVATQSKDTGQDNDLYTNQPIKIFHGRLGFENLSRGLCCMKGNKHRIHKL